MDQNKAIKFLYNLSSKLNKFYKSNSKKKLIINNKSKRKKIFNPVTNFKKTKILCNFHNQNKNLKILKKLDKLNKNISRITLDAFSYCLLAEGKLDAVIESNLKIYDVAAIIPIVENAGGFITTWNNKNAEKAGNILATSNKKLHYKLLKILKS